MSWKTPVVLTSISVGLDTVLGSPQSHQADMPTETIQWVTINPSKGFHLLNIFFPTYFLLVVIMQVFPKSEVL